MKKTKLIFVVLGCLAFVTLNIYLTSCSKNRHCNDPTKPYYCGKWNLNKICSELPFAFVGSTYNDPYSYNQASFSSIEQCYQFSSSQYQYQYYECKSCYIENE
jgi:hypothetical protein